MSMDLGLTASSRLVILLAGYAGGCALAASFDAAPSALPLPEGNGLVWEDPREIHRVVVHFSGAAPAAEALRLEYWGSRSPGPYLPQERQAGGADVGWMELGNWYKGGWRVADVEARKEGSEVVFSFRPVSAKEFPAVKDYEAAFRYTLKIRVTSSAAIPKIERLEAFTDSLWTNASARLVWEKPPREQLMFEAFNGKDAFTFSVDDLSEGALFLPHLGVAALPQDDVRDYAAVAAEQKAKGSLTLYERIGMMPEQTWRAAWAGLPRKKSDIYFPLGADGGRQRFRLDPDGSIEFRSNDEFLKSRPGNDTPRLALESADVRFSFLSVSRPITRTIEGANSTS